MRAFSPFLFFMGQDNLVFDENDSVKIVNICMKNKIVYRDPIIDAEGRFSLWCTSLMSYALLRECNRLNIQSKILRKKGFPSLVVRYKNRIGLILGAVFAIVIMFMSDNYVWDVRVNGNESVTYTELLNTLSECGLSVGSKINELDIDAIETRTLLKCKKISWISINLQGTYANVQIREAGERLDDNDETKPSNLIAVRDGQIDRLELFSGNAMVRHGDVVRKGDILVSGIWDSNHYGMFVTRSFGKVYARTKREFRVEIPFEYETKTLKESKIKEKYLIFFSKEIKVFENAGNMGASCDTIESVKNLRFFSGERLPVGVRTVKEVSYLTETARYTDEEAMNVAYYRLREMMESELSGAELLMKNIECEITDTTYILYCKVECIENIAEMQEFDYVTPN